VERVGARPRPLNGFALDRTTTMQPIATYAETRLEGRRKFTLLPDRLLVSGKGFAGDVELSFELATLSPVIDRCRIRPRFFRYGFLLLLLPWCSLAMFRFAIRGDSASDWITVAASLSIVGFIIAAVSVRKVEYAMFKSQAGVAAVDIARAGREADRFDSFIDAVTKQIQVAKGAP
jgi:hypothetical protein